MGAALGVIAGTAVGFWALGPSEGHSARALVAVLLPAAAFGLMGAAALPMAYAVLRVRPWALPTAQGAGVARAGLGFCGAVAAAGLLALALHRGLGGLLPSLGWRPRTGLAFGIWLLVTLVALRALGSPGGARVRLAFAAAAAALALGVLAAGREADSARHDAAAPHEAAVPVRPRRPNLALIVLDTTRADRLSLYGNPRPTSPFLEELAKDATVYDAAISAAPWTLPSHASIFTGQLPSVHGATTEHRYLDDRFVTLAELLRDAGYATAGFSSNSVAGSIYNLQQGFEHFDDVWRVRLERPDDPLQRLLPAPAMRWLQTGSIDVDKGAAIVNRRTRAWLDQREADADERPFFLFVNYVEAHLPYNAPEPFRSQFVTAPLAPRVAPLTGPDSLHVVFNRMGDGEGFSATDLDQLRDLYDAGLAYQDARLRELVSDLAARGLLEDTLFVVVSDHGENLGEHGGLLDHAFSLHQTLLHVPLLVRYPPLFARGAREREPVSTVGIFSTLLEAAGVAPDPGWPPAVAALPRGAAGGSSAPAFAVSEYGLPVFELSLLANEAPGTDIRRFAVRQRAVQDATHKLVLSSEGSPRLFDLASDPNEERPLPAEDQRDAARLAGALRAQLAGTKARSGTASHLAGSLDGATRDALRALGYVE